MRPHRWGVPISLWLKTPHGAVMTVFFAALLWGSAFPAIKRSYAILEITTEGGAGDAMLFAALRFLIAGMFLLVGSAVLRLGVVVRGRQLAVLALLGVIQTTLQYATFYVGMMYTTGVKASIIVASGSFFLAILSPYFYRDDRITTWRVIGLVLGFSGVVLANVERGAGPGSGIQWLGDGLILATGLCSALASLVSKKLVQKLHPAVVNGYQVTIGATLLLLVALPFARLPLTAVDGEVIGLTFYLAMVTSVAFTLYYVVVKHHDLSRVAAYRFMIPVSGIALSALLVPGESLGLSLAFAGVLVALGVWSVNR